MTAERADQRQERHRDMGQDRAAGGGEKLDKAGLVADDHGKRRGGLELIIDRVIRSVAA